MQRNKGRHPRRRMRNGNRVWRFVRRVIQSFGRRLQSVIGACIVAIVLYVLTEAMKDTQIIQTAISGIREALRYCGIS
mgnify:CR=1 FL=1